VIKKTNLNSDVGQTRFDRREFLTLASGTVGVALASAPLLAGDISDELPTHRFSVRRDVDLLSLKFEFVNFERRGNLLKSLGAGRSLVVVHFPPQNLAEARFDKEARLEKPPKPTDKPKPNVPEFPLFEESPLSIDKQGGHSPIPPVATYLSGPSWIVFGVPDLLEIPLNIPAARQIGGVCGRYAASTNSVVDVWLNLLSERKILVPKVALEPGSPAMPGSHETCIEIPFRLFIAPRTKTAKWITSSACPLPISRPQTAVELWHAAMHDRTKLIPATAPKGMGKGEIQLPKELAPPKSVTLQARAVFSPDYIKDGKPPWNRFYPGNLPLSHRALTRHLLVKQMCEGKGDGWIDAERLVMSSLGASASLSYLMQTSFRELHEKQISKDPAGQSEDTLVVWKHRQVVGRDVYLLSAYAGWLFPFVLPSIFVELTRRTFVSRWKVKGANIKSPFGAPGGYLLTEYFIVVVEPVKQFSGSANMLGRGMPIKKVTVLEPRSPNIQCPPDGGLNKLVPKLLNGGAPLRWALEFEDESGRKTRTTDACMVFSNNVVDGNNYWNSDAPEVVPIRKWAMPGERIGLAPDEPKITVPATNNSPAKGHALTQAERAPAAKLAQILQPLIKPDGSNVQRILGALQATTEVPTDLPAEAQQALSGLNTNTRDAIKKTIDQLQTLEYSAQEISDNVVGQLKGAEQFLVGSEPFYLNEKQRKAAAEAGCLLENALNERTIDVLKLRDQLIRLPGSLNEFDANIRQQLESLEYAGQEKLAAVAQHLDLEKKKAERALENVLRQLNNAEQAATDVEVHAVEFVSRQVNNLFNEVVPKASDLLNQAGSCDDFKKLLDAIKLEEKQLKDLKSNLDSLWDDPRKNWNAQKADAEAFFNDLQTEADSAAKFLRHGFQAQLATADVIVPALKAMGGVSGPQELKLLSSYAAKGIDKVQNSVFGEFTKAVDDGKAMADSIKCAVAAPAAKIAGLSRDLGGLVGDGEEAVKALALKSGDYNLRNAIPDFKILGVLPLDKIVSSVLSGAELPKIKTITLPDKIEQVWEWNAPLQKTELGIITFEPKPQSVKDVRDDPVHIYIKTTTRIDLPKADQAVSGAQPKGKIHLEGKISYWDKAGKKPIKDDDKYAFAINMLKLIELRFIDTSFEATYDVGDEPKPKVKPRLGTVEFLPPLDFVKKLQDLLPFLGKGFDIVQTPARIGISYEFNVPAIAFGAFSMRNLSINSAVLFSLEGKPMRFDFAFSSWKEPFELTVLCFGGRGFLKVAADTGGYRELQGMIEFGGALSFNVAIASGGLYVMAGIYFKVLPEFTSVSGFFRAGGTLNVLGLINASVEVLLMASYVRTDRGSVLAGEASITVCIDVFITSFDVTVRMYKEFAGSSEQSSGDASIGRSGVARLVSFATNGTSREPDKARQEPPQAYFDRPGAPNAKQVRGRFKDLREWDETYWSQFSRY
jgi:hypothetical protein